MIPPERGRTNPWAHPVRCAAGSNIGVDDGPANERSGYRARGLIAIGTETRNLDLKGPMPRPAKTTKARYDIVCDILAFTNTPDGGTLLIGVERTTHVVVGLTPGEVKSWDTTKVAQGCAIFGPPPVVEVSYPEIDGKQLVMIEVAPSPRYRRSAARKQRTDASWSYVRAAVRTLMAPDR